MNMIQNGIDISHWNLVQDFSKVKSDGVSFIILKAGGSDKGFYEDVMFSTYYERARKEGFHLGAYYFVGKNFKGYKNGTADAKRFIRLLRNKKFDMPLYVDVESTNPKDKVEVTEATIAFCDYVEACGGFAGIYSSDISGFKERLDLSRLENRYALWVARYGSTPKNVKNYGVWQWSSTGKVRGISGNVDLNKMLIDYPTLIRKRGLNIL